MGGRYLCSPSLPPATTTLPLMHHVFLPAWRPAVHGYIMSNLVLERISHCVRKPHGRTNRFNDAQRKQQVAGAVLGGKRSESSTGARSKGVETQAWEVRRDCQQAAGRWRGPARGHGGPAGPGWRPVGGAAAVVAPRSLVDLGRNEVSRLLHGGDLLGALLVQLDVKLLLPAGTRGGRGASQAAARG